MPFPALMVMINSESPASPCRTTTYGTLAGLESSKSLVIRGSDPVVLEDVRGVLLL